MTGRSRRSLLRRRRVAAAAFSLEACAAQGPLGANGEEMRLNFYNWDNYIGRRPWPTSRPPPAWR